MTPDVRGVVGGPPDPLGAAPGTIEEHVHLLAKSEAEVAALRAELDETSRGLMALYAELQTANQRVADLVAMLSHDIRQPLSVITSYCTLMREEWDTLEPEVLRDLFDRIAAAGIGMTELVEEILTLTQLDADGMGSHGAPVDVRQTVAEAIGSVYGAGPETVTVQEGPQLWAFAEPRHVHQILTNLLSNALKYGAPPIEITMAATGDSVTVTVHDHGDGVPADFVPRLFDRFTRADTPAVYAKRGTGLGLYIVRQLTDANSGAVDYHDHPDGGGCFTVRLPAGPKP